MKSFNVRVTLVNRDWVLSTCDDKPSIILYVSSIILRSAHVVFVHFLSDETSL